MIRFYVGGVGEGTYRENSTNGVEVVSEANIGEGKVIFISDTSIFTNRYYEQLDNKEFILKVPNSSARMDIKLGNDIKVGWNSFDARALDPK